MNVTIIGTGYVGLVSAACYAEHGHDVVCVDVDERKVEAVNAGRAFLHEPGLQELLDRNVPDRLTATTDLPAAVARSELVMVAVPTPFDARSGRIDLSYVLRAAQDVGAALESGPRKSVILKSTCVPGTTLDSFHKAVARNARCDFGVGSCPEFLSEGTAVDDFLSPDRLVLGESDPVVAKALRDLHAGFEGVPLIETNPTTAEAIKYASNAFLATCISFANEVADACEAAGDVDANEVMRGVHLSRYLTTDGTTAPIASFLMPGCGYGGSCLPKDVAALAGFLRQNDRIPRMLDAVATTNDTRGIALVDRVARQLGTLTGKRVVVLGTAFKPGTGDLRTSPAEPIIDALLDAGAVVTTHDPLANEATRERFEGRIDVTDDAAAAVRSTDAVILCTAWSEYKALPAWLTGLASQPVVADGRRLLSPDSVDHYVGVGLSRTGKPPMRSAA
ncbi:MAG: UDP-glucose/GDP-mannose dehydrogenase family protein [Planctomycetota bacterium]